MENLEMNIDNYNYQDLLNLFHLNSDFSKQDLKNAKSIVYKVHPDKSGLDKKYFLFFSKAFKMLNSIYQFSIGSTGENGDYDEYTIISKRENSENKKILDQHKEYAEIKTNPEAFNNWFNDLFEKNKDPHEENDGHGDWLSSEMKNVEVANNPTEMAALIEKQKIQAREKQLTIYKTFEPLNSASGEALVKTEGPQNYQSGLFSKLQYDDLKEVHENGVIPITNEDYKNRKTFRNMDEMNRQRKMDELHASDMLQEHNNIINNIELEEKNQSVNRFYELMKQEESQRKRNDTTWSNLKRLK